MIKPQTILVAVATAIAWQNASADIEQITVTAQKRNQLSTEIPFSVSALSGDQLERQGIDRVSDLTAIIPNLYISANSPNFVTYSIRGISSGESSAQAAPRVAVYLNDVDISRNRSSYIELHDMNRVEIVRGSQATLFGTTASAGAIAYYTNTPQQDFSSRLSVAYGSEHFKQAKAYITGGGSDVQARLAMLLTQRDGYIENQFNGDDLGGIDRTSIRPSVQWLINPHWQANISYTHEVADDTVVPNKSGLIAPPGGDTSPYSRAAMSGSALASPYFPSTDLSSERRTDDVNVRIVGQRGAVSFTSISAYRDYNATSRFDGDGSQAWAFELYEQSLGHQFSQEFRVNLASDRLDTVVGVSYLKDSAERSNGFSADEGSYLMCVPTARAAFAPIFQQAALANPALQPLATIINPANQIPCANSDGSINSLSALATGGALSAIPYFASLTDAGDNESASVYIDANYQLSEAISLAGGIRYINEHRNSAYSAYSPSAVLLQNLLPLLTLGDTAGQTIVREISDSDLLFRFNSRYQWRLDHYIYASYSEGRRSPVSDISTSVDFASLQTRVNVNQVPAEKLQTYELGIKGRLEKFSYSVAAFYQDYRNFQISYIGPAAQLVVANAGDTSNPGVEAEFSWQASGSLGFFGSLSVIDNHFDTDIANGNFAGKQLVYTPARTAMLGVNWGVVLAQGWLLSTNVYGNYRSDYAFDEQRQPGDPVSGLSLTQAAVTLVNANISLASAKADWALRLWGDNLTNKRYLLDASSIGANLGMPTYAAAPPRAWGIALELQF